MPQDPGFWMAWGLVALAAAAAWAVARRRPRRNGKPGGLQMLGAMMLGLGEPMDPPSRHVAEAKSGEPRKRDDAGDPPTT